MEIIVILVVVAIVGYLIFRPRKEEAVVEAPAPYKVEAPVVEETTPVVEETTPVAEPKKKPAAKKTAGRKPKAEGAKKPAVKAKTTRSKKTTKSV